MKPGDIVLDSTDGHIFLIKELEDGEWNGITIANAPTSRNGPDFSKPFNVRPDYIMSHCSLFPVENLTDLERIIYGVKDEK